MKNSFDFQKEKEQFDLTLEGNGTGKRRSGTGKKKLPIDWSWYNLGRFGELGFQVALPIAGGALLGRFIDDTFSLRPRATLFFLFLGVVVAFYAVYRLVRDFLTDSRP